MAKGNLLLGMGRGSIGDVTLYRANGQQCSRARNRVVKNPKTAGQQIQRMIAATVGYAYSGLASIVDHSFEGVPYGGPSMNRFRKLNMDKLRATATTIVNNPEQKNPACFAMKGVRTVYPNAYVISTGSIESKATLVSLPSAAEKQAGFTISGNVSKLTILVLLAATGAMIGDQLTFVAINNALSDPLATFGEQGRNTVYGGDVAIRRIKFKTSYTDEELAAEITSENFADLFDMEVTSPWSKLQISKLTSDSIQVLFADLDSDVKFGAFGLIVSRKQGDKWLRSTSSMFLSDVWLDEESTEKFGLSFDNALAAWLSGSEALGVSSYLLNAKPNDGANPEVDEGEDQNP